MDVRLLMVKNLTFQGDLRLCHMSSHKRGPHITLSQADIACWSQTSWLLWHLLGAKTVFLKTERILGEWNKNLRGKFAGEVHWRGFEQRGFRQRGGRGRGVRWIINCHLEMPWNIITKYFETSSQKQNTMKRCHKIPWSITLKYHEISPQNTLKRHHTNKIPWNVVTKYHEVSPWNIITNARLLTHLLAMSSSRSPLSSVWWSWPQGRRGRRRATPGRKSLTHSGWSACAGRPENTW